MGNRICRKLASGVSLETICKPRLMPNIWTVYRWLNRHPEFSKDYARARELQAETMADRMVQIAMEDQGSKDPQMLRVKIDAIKWAAGKMRPTKYGEANLLKKRTDLEFEREMIDITPKPTDDEHLLNKKQLARVIWHTLFSPEEDKDGVS